MLESPCGYDAVTLASGTVVSRSSGFPTRVDMAWQLGRICRYAGSAREWWPVLLHTFVVADLCPARLKFHAHIHDSPECVGNDVPKPVKTRETSEMEEAIFERTLKAYRVSPLNAEDAELLHIADRMALYGEVWTIGNAGHRKRYETRYPHVEVLVRDYQRRYPVTDCIDRGGRAAWEFLRRFDEYLGIRLAFEDYANASAATTCKASTRQE